MLSETFYVLIKYEKSWEWERETIITGSRLKGLLDELCEKLDKTVNHELSKRRDWLTNIEYRVQTVNGIYVNSQADQIFKDHMEELECLSLY